MTAGSASALTLDVAEDPDKVRGAFIGSAGLPFRLTDAEDSSQVYINPPSVAFWTSYVPSAPATDRAPDSDHAS